MLKQLYTPLGEYRRDALLTPFLVFEKVLMGLFVSYVMAGLIGQGVLSGNGVSYTVKMDGLMILMALATLIFGALAGRLASRACTGLAVNLRTALFDKVVDFSFSNVDHFSSASLITCLASGVANMQNTFLIVLRMGLRAPILLAGAASMAVPISRRLFLIFLAALPILATAIVYMMRNGHPRFQQILRRVGDMNTSIQKNLTGIRIVKAYVRKEHEAEKFTGNTEALRKAQFFAERLVLLTLPILQLVISGCIVAVVQFGGNLVITDGLELGRLSAFLNYVSQILMPLVFLPMIFLLCVLSRTSVTRIQKVLAKTPSIQDIPGLSSELAGGSIEFINASFSYGGPGDNLTLEHISLSIRSGKMIGIIDGTDSAKSTLIQLIPRLYDLSDGQLLVGSRPVREYSLDVLRKGVSMILQKNTLFSGTIRESLLWGNPNATQQELENVCRAAQAKEFIDALPNGLETHMEQDDVNLSGEQKQWLCIAHTLPSHPKIMTLSDSTSAMDTATGTRIREDLRRELHDATILLIAQRIGSLRGADRIIVVEDRIVSGVGTHEELLVNNPIYREIAESQEEGGVATWTQ